MQDTASLIDSTLLKPEATAADIRQLCADAVQHRFHAVCVNGCWVELARHCLEDTDVKVVTVVGFPLGGMDPDVKRYETEAAIDAMAQEIEVVLNVGRLRERDAAYVLRELRDVVEAADERPVKVIIEAALLSPDETRLACELIPESGAKFVQTSTGYSGGATVEAVRFLREQVGSELGIKACGGIRDAATALALIEAGATRIGSSHAAAIVQGTATRN